MRGFDARPCNFHAGGERAIRSTERQATSMTTTTSMASQPDDVLEPMPAPRYWLAGGETLISMLAERRDLGEPRRVGRRPNAAVAVTLDQLAVIVDDLLLLGGGGVTSPWSAIEWQARELIGDALAAVVDEMGGDDVTTEPAAVAAAWARRLPLVTDGAI